MKYRLYAHAGPPGCYHTCEFERFYEDLEAVREMARHYGFRGYRVYVQELRDGYYCHAYYVDIHGGY